MPRLTRSVTHVLGLAVLALPAIALAQAAPPPPRQAPPPAGMRAPDRGPMRTGVSRLIDARRELDLTPRQLVQLDSIERVQVAERRAQQAGMIARRDSLRRDLESLRGAGRDSLRAAARARMEAMRPQMEQARRRDSATMAAAERILTEPQRQRLREMRAEERGFQRGLRQGQVRGMQGRRGPDGAMPERAMRERAVRERAMRERAMRERESPARPMPEARMRRPDAG